MVRHQQYHQSAQGFTIIEVTLVLAISMFLFIGVIGGTTLNITRQRYNDSVNSFAEFLRRQYSEVISTENTRTDRIVNTSPCTLVSTMAAGNSADVVETGRANCLIYGKLITFNENNNPYIVHTYDIVGDARTTNDLESLNSRYNTNISNILIRSLVNLNVDVLTARNISGACKIITAGNESLYNLEWGSYVQATNNSNYTGSIAIVRSPLSGAISTFRISQTVNAQQRLANPNLAASSCQANNTSRVNTYAGTSLRNYLSSNNGNSVFFGNATTNVADFCINSPDVTNLVNNKRRMVSLAYDGYNASAVMIADQDSGDNKCQ